MSPVHRTASVPQILLALPRRVLSKLTPPAPLERQPQQISVRQLVLRNGEEPPAVGDILYLDPASAHHAELPIWPTLPPPAAAELLAAVRVEGVHPTAREVTLIPLPAEDTPQLGGTWWRYDTYGLRRREPPPGWVPPPPDFERVV